MAKLEKSIGFVTGTAYCVTVIVGAGILGLPGVAATFAGSNAPLAWLLDFFLAIPLLFVFGKLITKSHSAGGISDFVKLVFGPNRLFRYSQILLLMTLIIGTAAIALVGANYLSSVMEFSRRTSTLLAMALILVPTLINSFGIRIGGRIQSILAGSLISFLLIVIFSSLKHWSFDGIFSIDIAKFSGMWKSMGLIWFAFTGIEMISFLGEEFKSTRSFITSVITSFLIVGFLYLGLAIALKVTVLPQDPLLQHSPLVAILNATMGNSIAKLGGFFGFALILINQCGAMLGASRLVFSVGREGVLLPMRLGILDSVGSPRNALWALAISALFTLLTISYFNFTLEPLFEMVSQNWFLLYVLSIAAFLKMATGHVELVFGIIALILACIFMSTFSSYLLIPALLFIAVFFRRDIEIKSEIKPVNKPEVKPNVG